MGNVYQMVILPSQLAWGQIERETQELVDAAMDQYESFLCRYDDETLKGAFDAVAATWRTKYKQNWPEVSQFIEAANRICRERERARPAPPAEIDSRPPPSPESIARVNAMVQEFKRNMAMWQAKQPGGHGTSPANTNEIQYQFKTFNRCDRDDFEGRRSCLGWTWHAPTLAEHIAKQDAGLSKLSKRIQGDRDDE